MAFIKPGSQWQDILKNLDDIYYDPAYTDLYHEQGDETLAFLYEDGNEFFFCPFIKKPLPGRNDLYDIQTAYGYGGPLASTTDPAFLKSAWTTLAQAAKEAGIIAALFRFHPLSETQKFVDQNTVTLFQNFDIVYVDLSQPYETIFKSYDKTNRRRLRKAEREGLTIEQTHTPAAWQSFHDIYQERMAALGAASFYKFDQDYFTALGQMPEDKVRLYLASHKNETIGGAVCLTGGPYGHTHLSAAREDYFDLSPNNALIDAAVRDMIALKKSYLILGGGRTPAPDDPLLAFKKHFSPLTKKQYLGSCIFDTEAYENICKDWEKRNPNKTEHYKNYCFKYRY